MAAFDAFKLVRELVDRVGSVLPRVKLGLPELGRGDPDVETGPGATARTPETGSIAATPAANQLDSRRLDAALERLRASTPPTVEGAEE